jgi:hypothetical protein
LNFVAPSIGLEFLLAAGPIIILAVTAMLNLLFALSRSSLAKWLNLFGIAAALALAIANIAVSNFGRSLVRATLSIRWQATAP